MSGDKAVLEDYKINIRLKLSALWTAVMFLYIYGDYFELYVPGKASGLVSGDPMLNSPMKLFVATVVLALPALMIFLSLMLSPRTAKWLNIGLGAFFTLFTLLVGMMSFSEWRIFYVFLSFTESIITALIVWLAFSWPRLNNQ